MSRPRARGQECTGALNSHSRSAHAFNTASCLRLTSRMSLCLLAGRTSYGVSRGRGRRGLTSEMRLLTHSGVFSSRVGHFLDMDMDSRISPSRLKELFPPPPRTGAEWSWGAPNGRPCMSPSALRRVHAQRQERACIHNALYLVHPRDRQSLSLFHLHWR